MAGIKKYLYLFDIYIRNSMQQFGRKGQRDNFETIKAIDFWRVVYKNTLIEYQTQETERIYRGYIVKQLPSET